MQVEFPGLFDLQVNGFAGVDFNDGKTTTSDVLLAIGRLRQTGVTRFLPTLITSSLEQFATCARTLLKVRHEAIAGLHMEGPYISPEDGARGTHARQYVGAASVDDFLRRQELAEGQIRIVTLAPEVPGAIPLIEYLVETKVRVAIGHTAATASKIRDAVMAGATLSTHLGNGCDLIMPRHPNLIWDQLANDGLHASLIADGHHLPAATVKAMVRAKQPERIILVTDATAAAGCGPGVYSLAGETVVVDESGRVAAPGKPWLAGSALTMDRAVAQMVAFTGLPLATVWDMASVRPAEYLGLKAAGRVTAKWYDRTHQLSGIKVVDAPSS